MRAGSSHVLLYGLAAHAARPQLAKPRVRRVPDVEVGKPFGHLNGSTVPDKPSHQQVEAVVLRDREEGFTRGEDRLRFLYL